MQIASLTKNRGVSHDVENSQVTVTALIGPSPVDPNVDFTEIGRNRRGNAQTFNVEFEPSYHGAPPHFHTVDQYQIFYRGSGRLGKHVMQEPDVMVHYTDRYVSYGPILPDAEHGLAYLTVRLTANAGLHRMPEERRKRLELGGRHYVHHVAPKAHPSIKQAEIIPPQPDGLFAEAIWMGSNQTGIALRPPKVAQQLLLVGGAMTVAAEGYTAPTVISLRQEELPLDLIAGPDGAVLLSLHFPDPTRALAD